MACWAAIASSRCASAENASIAFSVFACWASGPLQGQARHLRLPQHGGGRAAQASADAQQAHAREVADAQKSSSPTPKRSSRRCKKPDDAGLADAQKALQKAAAGSTMYRTAAAWFGTPVKDLTAEQFERFKRIASLARRPRRPCW